MQFFYLLPLIFLLALNINLKAQLISEFMAAPINNAPEWIEIFYHKQITNSDTIYLKDATNSMHKIHIDANSNHYCIVTKDTLLFKSFYQIPDSTTLIQAKLPILNNTDDYIFLYNSHKDLIDSLYYKISKGDYGISIERISQNIYFQNSNFTKSIAKDSNTAGYINSVDNNKGNNSLNINFDEEYDKISFSFINNSNFDYLDLSLKIIFDKNEYIQKINKINSIDTLFIEIPKNELIEHFKILGTIPIHIIISSQSDTIEIIKSKIYLNIPNNVLYFNEILFDTDSLNSEFIELYNYSNYNISLEDINIIKLKANDKSETYHFNDKNIIYSKDYFLITGDSAIFNVIDLTNKEKINIVNKKYFLNNAYDSIIISDKYFNILDSIFYNANFHNSNLLNTKNRSLERKSYNSPAISPSNLFSCLDPSFSTPLKANYILNRLNNTSNISISKSSFNKEIDSECIISINNKYDISFCEIKLFDIYGNFIKTISNIDNIGSVFNIDIAKYLYNLANNPYIINISLSDAISKDYSNYQLLITVGK